MEERSIPVEETPSREELLTMVKKHSNLLKQTTDEDQEASDVEMDAQFWHEMLDLYFICYRISQGREDDDLVFFVRTMSLHGYGFNDNMEGEPPFFVRRWSPKLDKVFGGNPSTVDWRRSFYLNLIAHTSFTVTVAICSIQALHRHQCGDDTSLTPVYKVVKKVYASPSRVNFQLDHKKAVETSPAYPNICFAVDDFDDTFDAVIMSERDHCFCVLLNAHGGAAFPKENNDTDTNCSHRADCDSDRVNASKLTLFSGFVSYQMVHEAFDAGKSGFGNLFSSVNVSSQADRLYMRGPGGRGEVEVAVSGIAEPESGPVDGSVLYLQEQHRSNNEQLMRGVKIIDCLDHSQSCDELMEAMEAIDDLRVQQLLHQAGFRSFLQLRYIRFDRPLLTALCDRWRPESSTFHFSVGEMTITLQDVAILLGLPIEGAAVSHFGPIDADDICLRLLGEVPPEGAVYNGRELKVTYLINLIRGHEITADSSVDQIEQFTRAVILFVIASRLFPNHSKGRVSIRWLYLLEDFATIGDYSWGSAVLCTLFGELDNVSLGKSNGLAGCLTLIQVWSWTRLSVGRPNIGIATTAGLPYGARWTGARRWKDNPARHTTMYRNEMDVMDQSQVEWMPYTNDILNELPEVCMDGQQSWLARTPIISLQNVAMHYPDRVMRQFGLNQHIPDAAEKVFPDGWSRDLYETYVYRWNHRFDYLQIERFPIRPLEEYYSWYWHITRRFVLKESSSRLPRYAPRGPVERDLVQGLYMISNEVDDVLADPEDDDHVKSKCLSIKQIIKSILGRHKLERPPPYIPRPPNAFGRTYSRRNRRDVGGSSQAAGQSQPGQDIVDVGPSQPQPSQTQRRRTPREVRNLLN